jgi:hypothetical protein
MALNKGTRSRVRLDRRLSKMTEPNRQLSNNME